MTNFLKISYWTCKVAEDQKFRKNLLLTKHSTIARLYCIFIRVWFRVRISSSLNKTTAVPSLTKKGTINKNGAAASLWRFQRQFLEPFFCHIARRGRNSDSAKNNLRKKCRTQNSVGFLSHHPYFLMLNWLERIAFTFLKAHLS